MTAFIRPHQHEKRYMGKSLVIVESPAKAKTINKYLGSDFIVKSSVGHIRDLPVSGGTPAAAGTRGGKKAAAEKLSTEEKQRRQLVGRMGIDPDAGWVARYEILPGKEKVVAELRKHAEQADTIYLATDLDREGEAIAWHLMQAIGGDESKYQRVVFNEITKNAIQEAFRHPGKLQLNRVNAQQARRFLDRVVGYMLSPLLWAKVARGLSAGRVQSVAVRLIVEREKEIRAFLPEEYWELDAETRTPAGQALSLAVKKAAGKPFRPGSEADTQKAMAAIRAAGLVVSSREDKPGHSKPTAPFITSTLQQAASTRLGFSVKKTMTLAQRLYEAGFITYMRTDSTNLSDDAVQACRDYVQNKYGPAYLPEAPRKYASKSGAQEAHEAIRPSDVNRLPADLDAAEKDAQRLYELIWRQFVACQMSELRYTATVIEAAAGDYLLAARGRVIDFDGFTRVQPPLKKDKDDEAILPPVTVNDALALQTLHPSQHFTKPSPRYTEATLVRELEKRGIGRPSTYASIISTIVDRGYVKVESRRFYAEKMGDIVVERLVENFTDLMNYDFTARMESSLDEVAEGHRDWKALLDDFYADFHRKLEQARQGEQGMRGNDPTPTDIACPACGRPMMIRTASSGVFLGCSGYALPPKERCKQTINLVPGDEIAADDDEAESRLLRTKHRCPLCHAAMDSYLVDAGRKLHVCGNNPDCPGYEVESGEFRIKGYDGPRLECDKCGSEMQLKTGRFGKYFGCTNPDCKNTRKLLRNGQAAPPKSDPVPMPELRCQKVDDHYVLRDGAAGLFLAASGFPRNRETRAPLVRELLPHRAAIDPKFHYLLDGPQADEAGNPTVIRYSRKTAQQYLMTEVEGKATGWQAFFEDGQWRVQRKKA